MNLNLPFVRSMTRLSCWERAFRPVECGRINRARPIEESLQVEKRPTQLKGSEGRAALTLVEMLIAMAIALLMMAAVVTVFANISASVSRRRATIEMNGQLRSAREILSSDLAGATCPAIPWQKPDAANGYFELIEGPLNDSMPSVWLWDTLGDTDALGSGEPDELGEAQLDLALSFIPGSNLRDTNTTTDEEGRGIALGSNENLDEDFKTDGRGLGDGDDILMLTVRNETDQFVGRIPIRTGDESPSTGLAMPDWDSETIETPLAEVIWFAVENPPEVNTTFAFGEPGFRTVYRRQLLVAPWLEYRIPVTGNSGTIRTKPGVVRVLQDNISIANVDIALASLIAFQEFYDLSVRLEWDPLMPSNDDEGRWVLIANSLADLTKRENRYEHHGFNPSEGVREFPYAVTSFGSGYNDNDSIGNGVDLNYFQAGHTPGDFETVVDGSLNDAVLAYEPNPADALNTMLGDDRDYLVRPFIYVQSTTSTTTATARAYMNETGHIVHVTRGLVPLAGNRQGEDIIMTDVLAFDLRVYDPGAPLYGYYPAGYDGGVDQQEADLVLQPGDPAWPQALSEDIDDPTTGNTSNSLGDLTGRSSDFAFRWERNGAYVDLGYGRTFLNADGLIPSRFQKNVLSDVYPGTTEIINPSGTDRDPLFFTDGEIRNPLRGSLAPGYAVYDTWSWHYENNGMDEDRDGVFDEAVNGFDDNQQYGADDPSERETRPPYDTALRGVEAKIRAYERDSRQIRETTVRESFVPE